MPQLDTQKWLLIFQIITFLVTVVGWFFTGSQQRSILRETRLYQKKDRDLVVNRTRMERASGFTKSLIESSDNWYKLAGLAKATLDDGKPQAFQSLALPLLQKATLTSTEIAVILHDPQFRTLRNLLPPEIDKKLYDALKASSTSVVAFNLKTYNMHPTDQNIADQVKFVYEEAARIGDEIVEVADRFADAFAMLDKELTHES
jgi:hypothetical protein